ARTRIPNKTAPKRHANGCDCGIHCCSLGTPATVAESERVTEKGLLLDAVNALAVAAVSRIASEGDAGGDLRAVHHKVQAEIVVFIVTAKCSVTNLSKNGTR